jgi:hypothetical protein
MVCRCRISNTYMTLFIGEETMDNLLTIKYVFGCFELAYGLRVNFTKSCVMGINVDSSFSGMVETLNSAL